MRYWQFNDKTNHNNIPFIVIISLNFGCMQFLNLQYELILKNMKINFLLLTFQVKNLLV